MEASEDYQRRIRVPDSVTSKGRQCWAYCSIQRQIVNHTFVRREYNRVGFFFNSDGLSLFLQVISPRSSGQQMLVVPQARARGSSLPGNISIHQDDIYRLRNFSLAGKKIINRGDSLKTRSNHSIASGSNSRYYYYQVTFIYISVLSIMFQRPVCVCVSILQYKVQN